MVRGWLQGEDWREHHQCQLRWFHRSQVDVFGPRPKPESLTQEQLTEFRRRIQQIQPVQSTTVAE
jgi:hypothetical protein